MGVRFGWLGPAALGMVIGASLLESSMPIASHAGSAPGRQAGASRRATALDHHAERSADRVAHADAHVGTVRDYVHRRERIVRRTVLVPFATLIRYSKDIPAGQRRIVAEGHDGSMVLAYRLLRGGLPPHRVVVSRAMIVPPRTRVEVVGVVQPAGSAVEGQASWYGCTGLYAASPTLPFGTRVAVTDLDNGHTVTVVINDRGPYGVPGRIVDLCSSAFARLAPLGRGVAAVRLRW